MAIQTIAMTGYTVNPTENDVKGDLDDGAGRCIQETYLADSLFRGYGAPGAVVSGFVLPTSGSRTANTVTAGSAIVGGYYVTGTDTVTVTFEDATTSWVWLQLTTSSSLVTAAQLYVVSGTTKPTTPTAPAVYLGRVVTSGGNVTMAVGGRQTGLLVTGTFSSTTPPGMTTVGSANWTVTRNSTGNYTVTIDSGLFLVAPNLICTAYVAGYLVGCSATASSATSLTILTWVQDDGGTDRLEAIDANVSFLAIG